MPEIRFESIILVDPMVYKKMLLTVNLTDVSATRRDIWPNYDEAYKQFRTRKAYKTWDPRVLDVYLVRLTYLLCKLIVHGHCISEILLEGPAER
jgi:hypothetical protein